MANLTERLERCYASAVHDVLRACRLPDEVAPATPATPVPPATPPTGGQP